MTVHPLRLTGETVVLREFEPDDVDDALFVVGDRRVTDSLSFDHRDRAGARAMVDGIVSRAQDRPRAEYYLAVALPVDERLIGFVRLGLGGIRAAKLGYALRADAWGHGYATDAVRTLLGFAFGTLDLHRVSAAIGPANVASIALVDRLGFTHEGRIRDHVFTNLAWRDSNLYSLLAPEWTG